MSRDLRAAQEFRNKGRQMLSSPHGLLSLYLKKKIINRVIRDTVIKLSQSNNTDNFILKRIIIKKK